ncbi:YCF48-related protein [Marinobacter sp.]|uniref:YCF48-related protein n=1 Tax=Marinobacter sp. TaxID=50741 RepID=UPI003A90C832
MDIFNSRNVFFSPSIRPSGAFPRVFLWLTLIMVPLLASCGGDNDNSNNTAPAALSISSQPTSQTVTEGSAALFSVVAKGTGTLSYQWRRNGSDIAGAQGSSYTLATAALADTGASFTVRVSDDNGSVDSAAAILTVNAALAAPTITTQPLAQSVEQGQKATFTVTAGGTAPLSYQWQRDNIDIAGANAASYTTPVLTLAADDGAVYRVIVTNPVNSVTSSDAVITVTQTLLACSGGAQAGWCWIEPKPHGNTLRDVEYLGADVFVAAGGGGVFMRSTDGGATWSTSFAIGSSVNAMHFVSSTLGYVVGDRGFIARTDDGGQTWLPQISTVETTLHEVHFFDANLGLAVGDSGTILHTTDGGGTWTPITVPAFGHAFGVSFADADVAIIVGSGGARLRSVDGGASWNRIDTPAGCQTCTLISVTFTSATTGFAVGDISNSLMRTDDAGQTWTKVPGINAAGGSADCRLEDIRFSGTNALAVSTCGSVTRSTDGGITWTKFPAGGSRLETTTFGVAFGTGSAMAVAVGGEGQIYRTTNGGTSWTSIFPERVPQDFYNVYYKNASTAYILGSTSYKSTDSGLTWVEDSSLPSGQRAMASTNAGLFTAGGSQSIFQSDDGGLNWSRVLAVPSGSDLFTNFYFFNSMIGYAYGDGATVKTIDGGLTWTYVFGGRNPIVGIHFYTNQVGVMVNIRGIYRTVNGGASWSEVQRSLKRLAGAAFSGNRGVVVVSNGTVYRSSDQGATWIEATGVTTEIFRGVGSNPSGTLSIAYTESGNMLKSVDGSSWSKLASPVGGRINMLSYYNDSLGLAVGDDGVILRTTTGGE